MRERVGESQLGESKKVEIKYFMFGKQLEMVSSGIYSKVPEVPVPGTRTFGPPRSND